MDDQIKIPILLVDDDEDLLEAISYYLFDREFAVFTATDGLKAIEVLTSHEISLIVTDLFMPDMDGIELIVHIRKHHPNTKVIVMSGGHARPGIIEKFNFLAMTRAFGVSAVIEKPFEIDHLLKVARQVVNGNNHEGEDMNASSG